MCSESSQHGATLIELIASIVIVSIATFGLMLVISSVVARSADPMVEQQAAAIAQAYLEEISLAHFCDPDFLAGGQTCRQQCTASACSAGCGGSAGGWQESSRGLYDDLCDYDATSDVGARDRNGTAVTGLAGYRVDVDIVDAGVSLGQPAISANAGQLVRIDVTVRHPAMPTDLVLSAFRANTQ